MALSPGHRFGAYDVTDQIGAGGMGVVYRATDTNLKRDVAIKVLPESLATDESRLARFQREAELLASLNHPNIAQIYGLEKAGGTTALIMELIEGPTLADRIEQGALPADEALGIAMQIAEALEAAHGQGIIHRDLKPANIKLRPDGTVKVLDFGIAKALEPDSITSEPQSPLMTTPTTLAGVILGTAAYMSPEQARGKPVDQRADVWAFGCVLYEMLTGQPAFGGEDVPITLARVIANETDMESLPAAASLAVRQTIDLCLQKDLKKRVADIRDVRLGLEGAFQTVVTQAAATLPVWRRALPLAAAVIVTGLVVGGSVWVGMQPEPPRVSRFDYELPDGQSLRVSGRRVMAVSPDGSQFVFNTDDGLYLRTMSDLEARLIPGAGLIALEPAFSPDGQSVAYYNFATSRLERIAISGGAPVVVTEDLGLPYGLSWAADDTILFGQQNTGIHRVSANGGTPELVVPVDDAFVYGPQLLPDSDSVLFTEATSPDWDTAQIVVQSISTGERTVLFGGGADARYVPTGHLVYALGDGLYGIAFDPDNLTVSGGAVPLLQGVRRTDSEQTGAANFGVADDGTLVYAAGSVAVVQRTLVWVDREGRETPLGVPPRNYTYPRISPDGTKVALDVRDQEEDVWIWDINRETLTRLTFDPGSDEFPVWSPDGQRVAFSSTRGGGAQNDTSLFWQAADGTGSVERLAESPGQIFPASFLPDATGLLVFGSVGTNDIDDIAIVRFETDGGATPLLETTFGERNPELSPDGRWLAYASDESGSEEIYVRPFPDIDQGRWQVSTNGGAQPLWAPDGDELFYRSGEAMMSVSIETDPSFAPGNPEVLFEGRYELGPGGRAYDVSHDGERFLMIRRLDSSPTSSPIIIGLNWFTELERLVPTE